MQRNHLHRSEIFHQQQAKLKQVLDSGKITSVRKRERHTHATPNRFIKLPSSKSNLMIKFVFYIYVLNLAVKCAENVEAGLHWPSNDDYASNAITNSKNYKSYPAAIIDPNAVCRAKTFGYTAGTICTVDQTTYMLKPIDVQMPTWHGMEFNFQQVLINKRLLQYIDIATPAITIVYKENTQFQLALNKDYSNFKIGKANYFLASEWDKSFVTIANWFKQPVNYANYNKDLSHYADTFTVNTLTLAKQMQNNEFAKLIVAGSLIYDILQNTNNWGFNNNGLMIVDFDTMLDQPFKIIDSFLQALLKGKIGLSLEHLKQMLAIYNKLLTMELPQEPGYKSISPEDFTLVLTVYRDTCQQLVEQDQVIHINNTPCQTTTVLFSQVCQAIFNSYAQPVNNHFQP